MATYKLTYFDIDGGRAEPIRIAFHKAGIAFEDNRISFAEFGAMRAELRFNAVPILEIDGGSITQSNALSRYIGKMAELYPTDHLQALYCDEVLGALEDLTNHLTGTFGLQGEALKTAREKFTVERLTPFLKSFEALLVRGGGEYFADNQLSIADLKMFVILRSLRSGSLDHIPADIADTVAPKLVEHQQRIADNPVVKAYYGSRS
jgi:glutathione S-transferase